MKLSIHYQEGYYHASNNKIRTGCGITLRTVNPKVELNFKQFQHTFTCQKCRDYFTPKFLEEDPSLVLPPPKPELPPVVLKPNYIISGNVLKLCLDSKESVTISNTVEVIDNSAFAKCSGLISVEFPDSVTEIRSYAFALCDNLQEITIPYHVKLGENVFYQCPALEVIKIRFPGGTIGTFDIDALETMFQKL